MSENDFSVNEFIVREMGYPGVMKQEVVGELVRCEDFKHWGMHKRLNIPWCFEMHIDKSEDGYWDSGERRTNE